eukprot:TRINITY_DN34280_c0_g1_i1.p1 TRINITY_DN34280_c0_g1~~TRINITY_DN34280_c0_g1_i1.p1  ORF type:complete len:781 (+),score=227.32 TRINITY_DN34280_c0_g1_i1:207-2345(+)
MVEGRDTLGPLQVEDEMASAQPNRGILKNMRKKMTRSGRRELARRREVGRIHVSHPMLTTLMVVRIQRTWRGYITRKNIALVRASGSGISDLDSRRVIQSAIFQARPTTVDDSHFRQLPPSVYGAVEQDTPDTSPFKVRTSTFLWKYAVTNGGLGGLGLLFILAWHLGTTAACFLIPGWVAMVLKTIFYDGESAVEINKLVGWVIAFSLICGLGVGVLRVMIIGEAERFASKLDFVLSVLGMKKSRLITMTQLQEFRSKDLGLVKNAVYVNAPLSLMHGLHTVMALFAVLSFDAQLGTINFGGVVVAFVILSFYDRLVISQCAILESVAKREGAMRHHVTKRRIADEEYTSRNYQLALSKTLLRMTESYTRTHTLVLSTVTMLVMSFVVFFFYVGAHRVKGDHISVHTFVLAFSYFFFTQMSFYRFNSNTTSYIQSRWNMRRLFKLVWHFREFTDQQTFKERECAIIAQQEHMKEYRVQPRSYDLCMVMGVCIVLLVAWLLYFAGEKGDFSCERITVQCTAESGNGAERYTSSQSMDFGFDFFHACSPSQSRAASIRDCAQQYYDSGASVPNNYRSSVMYRGWRNDKRGLSKLMEQVTVGINVREVRPCPVNTMHTMPFRSERYLAPVPRTGIAQGTAAGVTYDGLDQIFWERNFFQGCWAGSSLPDGDLCGNVPEVNLDRRCWCAQGGPDGPAVYSRTVPACASIFANSTI